MPDVQYPDDPISNPPAIRIEDLLATDDASPSPVQAPVREGLPRSFRMRADKHYVEMLDAPAARPEGRAQPSAEAPPASTSDAAAEPTESATPAAVQAGRDLAQSLASLRTCTNLLSDRGPTLASAIAGNLIRAEACRATFLLLASRFLRGEIVPAPKPVPARAIVDQVLTSIEPERRLRGISVEGHAVDGESRVAVDEELIVGVLSGLALATIALQEEQSPLVLTLAAESHASDVVFNVVQRQVRAATNWATDSVAFVSAERLASVCGGRLEVVSTPTGTEIRVSLPRQR